MSWQYIAGFFDGEGSLTHNGKGFRVTVPQTNKIILEAIKEFSAVGHIIAVKKRKSHWKDSWVFYTASQKDTLFFLQKILKFTVVKHKLIKMAIPVLEQNVIVQQNRKRRTMILKKKAKNLRERGLTYRKIGKELGIDFGYARRLALK